MQKSLLKEKSSCRNVSEVLGFQTGKALFVFLLAHFPVCLSFSFCHVWSYLFRFYQANAWRFIARHDSKYTKRKLLKTREHWYNNLEIRGKQNLKCFVNTLSSVVRIRPGYRIGNKTADLMLMLLTSKTFFKICTPRTRTETDFRRYVYYLLKLYAVVYSQIPRNTKWNYEYLSFLIAKACQHGIVSFDSLRFPFLAPRNKNSSGDHCVTDNFSRQADVHFSSAVHRT